MGIHHYGFFGMRLIREEDLHMRSKSPRIVADADTEGMCRPDQYLTDIHDVSFLPRGFLQFGLLLIVFHLIGSFHVL